MPSTDPVHRTFLEYADHRYLKAAVALCIAGVVAYVREPWELASFGGSPTGYALGTLAAILILWLMWFGVRKRRHASRLGTVQGWLSAHVYFGAALLLLATLHTGFQVGPNVHTLAYLLMTIVILSGFYGVFAYRRYPTLLTQVMGDETLDTMFLEIASLDVEARRLALGLSDAINAVVLRASQETRVGGSLFSQLRGDDPSCPTKAAVDLVREVSSAKTSGVRLGAQHELYSVLVRKEQLLRRARRAVMYKARLDLWLYAHVPMTFALLAALAGHILSVFFYLG